MYHYSIQWCKNISLRRKPLNNWSIPILHLEYLNLEQAVNLKAIFIFRWKIPHTSGMLFQVFTSRSTCMLWGQLLTSDTAFSPFLLHKTGTCQNKTSWCKGIDWLALQHTGAEFSGRKTESTSLAGGNSLSNEVFFSYLQFLASFTTRLFFFL